jgi:hypothetical protein
VFGREKRKRESLERDGRRVPAEILAVEFGRLVSERNVGANTSLLAKRTLRVRVSPPGEPAYEAELKLGGSDPMVPTEPGAKFEVLVDAKDPGWLALPADPVFKMANGAEWRPPAAGIGRDAAAAAMAQAEQIREAAKRRPEEPSGEG